MKQANVKVGSTYECRIGAEIARVVVVECVTVTKHVYGYWGGSSEKEVVRFRVRRQNESSPLPKLRSAAALREI